MNKKVLALSLIRTALYAAALVVSVMIAKQKNGVEKTEDHPPDDKSGDQTLQTA